MQKKAVIAIIAIVAIASMMFIVPALAYSDNDITITPNDPSVSTTGVFTAYADQTTYNVYVLVVIPKSTHDALTGTASVSWTGQNGGSAGSAQITSWTGPIPSSGPGSAGSTMIPNSYSPYFTGYTGSSLQSDLGTGNQQIYYAWIHTTAKLGTSSSSQVTFTLNIPATGAKALFFLAGASCYYNQGCLDMSAPCAGEGIFNGPLVSTPEYTLVGTLGAIAVCFAAMAIVVKTKARKQTL